ncbi:MAG: acetyl-CoA hydrolase [Actinobacteria bacterium]|uniref:Acetyl-CoA hydrolase/transferase C-terminal domain-containing protein n=1 Tax=Nostocoides veronense TaxID=330836 RepID=A0ABP4YC66_9MICO|nr:acetyl-CoA hydrolase [Actinomycetota bacterium]
MQIVSTQALASVFSALPDNPRIVVSGNAATPPVAIGIIDATLERYTIHALNAGKGVAPEREGVTAETCFVGGGMRKHPGLSYVPARLSLVPRLFQGPLPPDAVILHCAPAREGQLSLGIECNILPSAIEACRARSGRIIAVINDQMPYTYGDAQIPVDIVDYAIEVSAPLPEVPPATPDEASTRIGELVAARVPDGATLQAGIGAIPDATIGQLGGHTGLRIWTETFSDGVLALDRGGAMDPNQPLTTSFMIGTRELYDWVDGNHRVRMMRTERTNDPSMIALQRYMTSINTALEIDLFGQANASRIKARIYSGFGGQTDFIVGALHSPGGAAYMALRSWHPKANVSTIVPLIDEPVTSFQQSAVVTENGVAELWGYSQQAQARHLIRDAAHPDVREELWEEAAELGLA